jgi:hypothetical protein
MKTLPSAMTLVLLLATSASALPTVVTVTTCGQVVPKRAIGLLTAGLDCRGLPNDTAIRVEKGGTLDLRGFPLSGGKIGVECVTPCALSGPDCFVPTKCTIKNGTVQDSTGTGIAGGDLTIESVTVQDHDLRGIDGGRRVKITDSTITNNGGEGAVADNLIVRSSTISGNGKVGLAAVKAIVKQSTVVDNDASPTCTDPAAAPCYDIGSARHPSLRDTTCKRSFAFTTLGPNKCLDGSWCVCSEDQ